MSKIKHLGKFLDQGDYIELPFDFSEGKYRVEIKPSGENKRDKTIYVNEDGKMRLPNHNGRKAFAIGSNIFKINKVVNGKPERITIDTYSRWSLFLKANTGTTNLLYTNLTPMPSKVGAYKAGTTFDEVDYKSLLDGLLYEYLQPFFNYFRIVGYTNSRYEVGTLINGLKTFQWNLENSENVKPNSIKISGSSVVLTDNLANTGSFELNIDNLQRLSKGSETWNIQAESTEDDVKTASFSVRFDFMQYWGSSAKETLDEDDIKNLQNSRLTPSSVLGNYTLNAGYAYFVFENSYNAPSLFKNRDTGFQVQMYQGFDNSENGISYDLVTVTNVNSVQKQYRVYRTAVVLALQINVTVS